MSEDEKKRKRSEGEKIKSSKRLQQKEGTTDSVTQRSRNEKERQVQG